MPMEQLRTVLRVPLQLAVQGPNKVNVLLVMRDSSNLSLIVAGARARRE